MTARTCILALVVPAALLVGPPAEAQTISQHDVQWIEGGMPGSRVPGAGAVAVREAGGVSMIIRTRHLLAGPVTVWLFFFACDPFGVCSNVPTNGGPMFATADVVTPNGKGTFAVGVPDASPFLTDPATDEIHAVIVDGKPLANPIWRQLTTPAGGTFRQVVIAQAQ